MAKKRRSASTSKRLKKMPLKALLSHIRACERTYLQRVQTEDDPRYTNGNNLAPHEQAKFIDTARSHMVRAMKAGE